MREEYLPRLNSTEIPIYHPEFLVYHSFHSDLFECLKAYSSGRLLDIGCGNKPYESIVKSQVYEYFGCDIVQSSENKVDLLCSATRIEAKNESFDTVISTQVIEHVADYQSLVNEAYRLLKKDGFFIISGPMYWPLHEEPNDYFRFTRHGFRHVLEQSGFLVIEEKSNGGKWALCGQVLIHSIYPDININNTIKWKIFRKVFNFFGGVKTLNRIFRKLDKCYPDTNNTMNYVFVAKK